MSKLCGPPIRIMDESIGSLRYNADMRRFGGMIFGFGITALMGALVPVSNGVTPGVSPNSDVGTIPFWSFVGACCLAFIGLVAVIVGYFALVVDQGRPLSTGLLILVIQLAWIPYITGMIGLGDVASSYPNQGLIPESLNPSQSDVNYVASMGILSILAHGFGYIGSLSFVTFSLYAYQVGKMSDRSNYYYKSRMPPYNFALMLAGFTQLALGAFTMATYGGGPLQDPINVAQYIIYWPEISVAVGALQFVVGMYGMVRMCFSSNNPNDQIFQTLCIITWICMIILELTVQISWAPQGMLSAKLPTVASRTLPLIFMPAFLDHMYRNTPEYIDTIDYYGVATDMSDGNNKLSSRNSSKHMDNDDDVYRDSSRGLPGDNGEELEFSNVRIEDTNNDEYA